MNYFHCLKVKWFTCRFNYNSFTVNHYDFSMMHQVESSIRSQLESVGIMEVESHNYVRVEDLATVEDVYVSACLYIHIDTV